MIQLFGCSFTNWVYPTWADYTIMHYDTKCIVHGKPGIGNQTIKKYLLLNANTGDTCIPMLSGIDRLEQGIDKEFIELNGFYKAKTPVTEQHWLNNFVQDDLQFVPLKHNSSNFKEDFSLFHALYTACETVVDMNNLATVERFDLTFLNWQHCFGDASTRKHMAGICKPVDINRYAKHSVFASVLDRLKLVEYLDNPQEGMLNYLHSDKQLFEYQNTWDPHPSSLAHFRYFVQYVKPYLDNRYTHADNLQELEQSATQLSEFTSTANSLEYPFYVENDNQLVHDKFVTVRNQLLEDYFPTYKEKILESHRV